MKKLLVIIAPLLIASLIISCTGKHAVKPARIEPGAQDTSFDTLYLRPDPNTAGDKIFALCFRDELPAKGNLNLTAGTWYFNGSGNTLFTVRHSGPLTHVELALPNAANRATMSQFWIGVFRPSYRGLTKGTGVTHYTLVYKENVFSQISGEGVQLFTSAGGFQLQTDDTIGFLAVDAGTPGKTYKNCLANKAIRGFQVLKKSAGTVVLGARSRVYTYANLTSAPLQMRVYTSAPATVLAIGDSIMAGVNSVKYGHGNSPTGALQAAWPGIAVHNAGIPRQTAPQMLIDFEKKYIAGAHPRIIIMCFGTNDSLQNEAATKGFYEKIFSYCRAHAILPVIVESRGHGYWLKNYQLKNRQLDTINHWKKSMLDAEQDGVWVAVRTATHHTRTKPTGDSYPAGDPGTAWDCNNEFEGDGIHFSAAGDRMLGKLIAAALAAKRAAMSGGAL